jgi:hypothetical protein
MARVNWKTKEQIEEEKNAPKPKGETDLLGESLIQEKMKSAQLQATIDGMGREFVTLRKDIMLLKNNSLRSV